MAIASTAVWEVRTTGSDTNGGGFDPGVSVPGTDYSVQDTAQITYTDLVIDAVTNTKLTSAANPFSSLHPGNLLNVTGGGGFTTGWYEVLSVTGTTATMDRAVGTVGSTGGAGKLGGGFASPGQAASAWVGSNVMYIKNGTYTLSASANVSGGKVNLAVSGTVTAPNIINGYNTNRTLTNTDSPPTLQAGAINMIIVDNNNGGAFWVRNLILSANAQTGCYGVRNNNNPTLIELCQATGALTFGFIGAFGVTGMLNCYATGCAKGFSNTGNASYQYGCTATACTTAGFADDGANGTRHDYCFSYANAGYGFLSLTADSHYAQCTSDGNTGANGQGFSVNDRSVLINCLASNNAKFGYMANAANFQSRLYNCGGYNNTSGNTDTSFTSSNNIGFVTLTAGPYTNSGGNDFSLNSIAGGGAAARSVGFPTSYVGISTNSYFDLGAAQHLVVAIIAVLLYPVIAQAQFVSALYHDGSAQSKRGVTPVPIVKPGVFTSTVQQGTGQPFPEPGSGRTGSVVFPTPFVPPPPNVQPGVLVGDILQAVPANFPEAGLALSQFGGPIPPFVLPPGVVSPVSQGAGYGIVGMELPQNYLPIIGSTYGISAVYPGPIPSNFFNPLPGSILLQPGLVCPIDKRYDLLLIVHTVDGVSWDYISWQCSGDPTHNGVLLIDPSPIPTQIAGTISQGFAIPPGVPAQGTDDNQGQSSGGEGENPPTQIIPLTGGW